MRRGHLLFVSVAAMVCMVLTSTSAAPPPSAPPIRYSRRLTRSSCRFSIRKRKTIAQPFVTIRFSGAKPPRRRPGSFGSFYKLAPDHKRMSTLLQERWITLAAHPEKGRYDELVRELESVLSRSKDPKLKIEASFTRAQLKLNPISSKASPDPAAVDEFLKLAPKDPRAADLLASAVGVTQDEKKRTALIAKVKAEFPDSDLAGMLRRTAQPDRIAGQALPLAIHGRDRRLDRLDERLEGQGRRHRLLGDLVRAVRRRDAEDEELYTPSIKRSRGRVHRREPRPIRRNKGASTASRNSSRKTKLPGPSITRVKAGTSEFSKSWGINSIPCVFVVDAEGKLHSVEARGKLEEMIPAAPGEEDRLGSTRAVGGAVSRSIPQAEPRKSLRRVGTARRCNLGGRCHPAKNRTSAARKLLRRLLSPARRRSSDITSERVGEPILEDAPHRAGDERAVGLVDAADRHATVTRLDHHGDSLGVELFHQEVGQLFGQPFLHLRALGEHVDDAGNLGQPDDLAVGDVGDVRLPDDRQQMMLAKADEANVLDQDHLVIFLREQLSEMATRVLMQALEDLGIHPGHAVGRFAQALPIGVFADGEQDLPDGTANALEIHRGDRHRAARSRSRSSPHCSARHGQASVAVVTHMSPFVNSRACFYFM